MKLKDVRTLVDIVRDSSKADLIIVSLCLLPILLGSWTILLNNFKFLNKHDGWKLITIIVVTIIYVIGLILIKWCDTHDEMLKRAVLHVRHKLERRKRASFVAIREEVNENYDDEFLKELIEKHPTIFRSVKVKRKGGFLPGITLVDDETGDG